MSFKKKVDDFIKHIFLGPFYIYSIYKRLKNINIKIEEIINTSLQINNYKNLALVSSENGIQKSKRKPKIVVSLTSYGYRVDKVYLVIESLFRQTFKPDKIVLWLAEDEFKDKSIPLILEKMKKRGLSIEFTKDIKSYKKLIPALKKFPNDLILTVDDDIVYPMNLVEKLYKKWKRNPNVIHCGKACNIKLQGKSKVAEYKNWFKDKMVKDASYKVFPIGYGGVLYFPKCLDKEVFNEKSFMELSPYSDDVWFKAMSLKNNVKCESIDSQGMEFLEIPKSQHESLWSINKKSRMNEKQFESVFNKYNLWGKLK